MNAFEILLFLIGFVVSIAGLCTLRSARPYSIRRFDDL
jgi:hypothetical protein